MTWRDHASGIIATVISETLPNRKIPFTAEEIKTLRRALRDAYPYGERAMHPYKIWCSEVKRQIGANRKACEFITNPVEG